MDMKKILSLIAPYYTTHENIIKDIEKRKTPEEIAKYLIKKYKRQIKYNESIKLKFNKDYRDLQILKLRFLSGKTHRKIGEIVGISGTRVRQREHMMMGIINREEKKYITNVELIEKTIEQIKGMIDSKFYLGIGQTDWDNIIKQKKIEERQGEDKIDAIFLNDVKILQTHTETGTAMLIVICESGLKSIKINIK